MYLSQEKCDIKNENGFGILVPYGIHKKYSEKSTKKCVSDTLVSAAILTLAAILNTLETFLSFTHSKNGFAILKNPYINPYFNFSIKTTAPI